MSEPEFSILCPVCGADLSDLDEMWRLIHVNGCLAGAQREEREAECPICGAGIRHLSAELANHHINACIDRSQRSAAERRPTERCPICGVCIRGLSERQRRIHDQTCRKSENAVLAPVIHYPKVVERLPTPAEWEVRAPVPAAPPQPTNVGPVLGRVIQTASIQGIDGLSFSNAPFCLSAADKQC